MAKVYITREIPEAGLQQLMSKHQVDVNREDRPLSVAELVEAVRNYDAVICLLSDPIKGEVLEAAQGQVKIFANYAVGYDNIDVKGAAEAGIYVSNTPGVLTEATADIAWALMLAAARHVVPAHKFTEEGKFVGWHPTMYMGSDFFGATLGIIGAGRIGQATARRATGFGMNILYYSRSPKPEMEAMGAVRTDLDSLLKASDFVSLHVPLNPETKGILNAEKLALMKPTAVLVNTARGPVLDEGAVARMLREGKLAAAGFDVYDNEPEVHPDLFGLDNAVLLPHLGSASYATRIKMARMAADNVEAVLAGGEPLNPVRP